ncbi:unnamed protein product [Rotaria socialis]
MNIGNVLLGLCLFFASIAHKSRVVCFTVTCDFELSECGWELDSIWNIHPSGSTPDTASSGPTMDHTTGNGNYARFIARLLTASEQFGIMNISTCLEKPTTFSFWYFMHGSQLGTLGLMVNDQTLWEKTGRQGLPAWHQANVTLPMGADINIKFVANRTGSGRSSDIAIDDIVLQGEAISISTRTPRPISTTTPRTRYNASCDFDVNKELCGWKSDTNYGWKVIRQREVNSSIGPSSDYSSIMRSNVDNKLCQIPYDEKGPQYYCIINLNRNRCKGSDNKWIDCRDGGFLQIESGEFDQAGERSQFDSPILDALSDEGCVQFHYNIAGSDNDELNVYVEDYWSGRKSCMWHKNGSTVPNRWITAEAPLKLKKDEKYKIVFEARKGTTGGTGLVSLDHFIVSSKACSGTYPAEKCPVEETVTTASTMISTEDLEAITVTDSLDTASTPITAEIVSRTTEVQSLTTKIESPTTEIKHLTTEALESTMNMLLTIAGGEERNKRIICPGTGSLESTIDMWISTNNYEEENKLTESTTAVLAATTNDKELNTATTSSTNGNSSPTLAIILGVLGGLIAISGIAALSIWHSAILSRLGIKKPSRIANSPTYSSASGGSVEINGRTSDTSQLI